jgi:hypothetical protein
MTPASSSTGSVKRHDRLRVFITVDTEFWPQSPDWRSNGFHADYERDILGRTRSGEYGLKFQLDLLQAHGLKAVFLVEALSVRVTGDAFLKRTVDLVQQYGQDVQLHAHTEWLKWMEDSPLPQGRTGQHLHCFSGDEQTIVLEEAARNLRAAGVHDMCAFRAGNYGADNATLRVLRQIGIQIDTSYNYPYVLSGQCQMRSPVPLTQRSLVEGIDEYPVSFFSDWPGHYRHAQLCACSSREMRAALIRAWEAGWQDFVIVSHSFELVKRHAGVEDAIVIRRMEDLCRFLQHESERFEAADFRSMTARPAAAHTIINGSVAHTMERYVQQAIGRLK